MSIPNFIRTKWNSNGAVLLHISDSYCEECQKECSTNSEEEDEEQHQIISTCSLHSKYTTCYISNFNVWELEYRKELLRNEGPNGIKNFKGKTIEGNSGVDSNHNDVENKEEHRNTTSASEESCIGDESPLEEEITINKVPENSCPDLQSENQANQCSNDSVIEKSHPWYAIFSPSWWFEIFLNEEFSGPWYVIFSPFWWLGYGIDKEISNENSIKKKEKELLYYFVTAFKLKAKYFPTPMFSSKSLRITQVKKSEDFRDSYENLIKIEVNSAKGSESSTKVSIHNMSEEDIDYELYRNYSLFFNIDNDGSDNNLSGGPEAEKTTKSKSSAAPNFEDFEDWMSDWKITFDEHNNQNLVPISYNEAPLHEKIKNIAKKFRVIRLTQTDDFNADIPSDLPKELTKYWFQRYRLFLKYDEDVKLDYDSWFSVTPEIIAAHQAYRCACDTVVDAFCGAGSNAIQLAYTCHRVIAIDIDPNKIEIARHNARVYGVEDRIEFIQGDFFQLTPSLKADVVMLSPPWGEIDYKKEEDYDVLTLGGAMQCELLFDAARKISPNIALYVPKTSNIFQLIELAGVNGKVDIEYDYISYKRKAITAYYGNLADYSEEESLS